MFNATRQGLFFYQKAESLGHNALLFTINFAFIPLSTLGRDKKTRKYVLQVAVHTFPQENFHAYQSGVIISLM